MKRPALGTVATPTSGQTLQQTARPARCAHPARVPAATGEHPGTIAVVTVTDTVGVMRGTPTPSGTDPGTDQETWVHIGLDGEMSSAELDDGGRLIQAGAAVWVDGPGGAIETFSSLIRHDDLSWSERAAAVHGITREQVAGAPPATEVDEALYVWLLEHGAVEGRRLVVPIGLNVAAFDMPFFRQALPRSSALVARRAVDLNALCFTYAGWDPNPLVGTPRDFAGWKRSMKNAANTALNRRGMPVHEHDAGYDAAQALVGWWWLRCQVVDLTHRVADLDARLDSLDPLRAVLGDGLLDRLANVSPSVLHEIVAAFPVDVSPRRWFGTKHAALGTTPLQALLAGRIDEVVAAAQECR